MQADDAARLAVDRRELHVLGAWHMRAGPALALPELVSALPGECEAQDLVAADGRVRLLEVPPALQQGLCLA